jgi:hypothetical protein
MDANAHKKVATNAYIPYKAQAISIYTVYSKVSRVIIVARE